MAEFDQVAKRASQIAQVTRDRIMPPWIPSPGHKKFLGERWLTDRELDRIARETEGCAHRPQAIIRGSFAFCAADPHVPRVMFQTHFGSRLPGISEFMAEVASLRFMVIHQVMRQGLEAGELEGGDAGSLALVFCCLMDQHINVLARLPKPMSRLTVSAGFPRRT